MTRENILEQIQDIVRTRLSNSFINMEESTTASDVDGWNSLVHMEILNDIEEHFKIKFSYQEIMNIETVGNIVDCVEKVIKIKS